MKPTKEQKYEAILAAVDECPRGFLNDKNGQNRIDVLGKQLYPEYDWVLSGGTTGPLFTELGPKGLRLLQHARELWFTDSAFTPEVKRQILYRDKSLPAKLRDIDPVLYADITGFLLTAQAAPKITKEGVASMCGTLDADVDPAWRQISHFLTHGTLRQAVGEDSPMTWAVAGIENLSVNYARQHGFLEVRNAEIYEVPYVVQGMVGRKPPQEIIALHGKPACYSELQRQAISLESRLLSYLAGIKL